MGVTKNMWFWPIKENIDGKLHVVLQGDEVGVSKESQKRLSIFTSQFDIYKACDVSHDTPVLMEAVQEDGEIFIKHSYKCRKVF